MSGEHPLVPPAELSEDFVDAKRLEQMAELGHRRRIEPSQLRRVEPEQSRREPVVSQMHLRDRPNP